MDNTPSIGEHVDLQYRTLRIGFLVREVESEHVWLGAVGHGMRMMIASDFTLNGRAEIRVSGDVTVLRRAWKPNPVNAPRGWYVDLTENIPEELLSGGSGNSRPYT